MGLNEIVGWLATGITMLSFLFKQMIFLRATNLSACIVWIIYGVLTVSQPVIVTNTIIALIHLYWFYTNYVTKK